MQSLYPQASPEAVEVLDSLLSFLPENRLSIDDALKSKFLHGVAVGSPSLIFPEASSDFEFAFEYSNPTKYQLKEMIQHEVDSFCNQKTSSNSNSNSNSNSSSLNWDLAFKLLDLKNVLKGKEAEFSDLKEAIGVESADDMQLVSESSLRSIADLLKEVRKKQLLTACGLLL